MKKKFVYLSILISFLFIGSAFVNAQQITIEFHNSSSEKDNIWFENNPSSLPIWLTQEELGRLDEIGKGFKGSDPPPAPIRQPAEFEPMEGVLIRYPFGISYQIIAEMSEDVKVVTIVANINEKNYVISQYQSHGVNLDNCDYLIAPSNSYWTRDYGPWFIINGNDEQGIVDHIYNRPRPNDDQIPLKYGIWRGIPVYGMSLKHSGGNYMTDGQGIAISTNLVWTENPGYSHTEIDQMVEDYLGITTYHVVPDALGEYIKHIDCWAKYLAPDIIMIIEVSPSHSNYDEIEEAVEYFENQTSCYGTPYQVERLYTHLSEPYINSLILNNKVLVPIKGSQWDDEAIESYQNALPGYEVLGFTGSWQATDALHCRTMGITDSGMLYIEHTPLSGSYTSHTGYEIEAKIIAYSGEDLISESTGVYWKVEGGEWNFVEMEPVGNDYYHALIPAQEDNTEVYYYIHAEDESGRSENHPYIGGSMAYTFTAFFENDPPIIIGIEGPNSGKVGEELTYCIEAIDSDGDQLYYLWDWGDGQTTGWLSDNCSSHIWQESGTYTIRIIVKDEFDAETPETTLQMDIKKGKIRNYIFLNYYKGFPNIFHFLVC